MREITVLKDGILPRIPKITTYIRNTVYVILALSLIAAAVFKRIDYLDPSNMVTNIAVIAMVSYPVAAIFAILVRSVLRFFTSDEFTLTSRRIFGYAMLGRPADISIDEITDTKLYSFILKAIKIQTDENSYLFIGLRSTERIQALIDHFKVSKKSTEETAADTSALLKEYEELRKKNVISGAEWEYVKKQIIGL